MRIRTVSDTTTQVTRYGFVNAYLVRDGDGFILVDTTMNAADQLIAAAPGAIRCIVVTHGHRDHVRSLDALKEKLPDVPVHMSAIDAAIHAGERPKTKGMWPKLRTKPDMLLQPGDRIGSLEVIPAPGHTPGQGGLSRGQMDSCRGTRSMECKVRTVPRRSACRGRAGSQLDRLERVPTGTDRYSERDCAPVRYSSIPSDPSGSVPS
jgi:Metallo-beta-lactamase superfamily